MIERAHLAIIRAVDDKGTLTEAADALCLTQSALSHSIKKLEQHMGTEVWLREGRTLRLTQAGHYLLLLAKRLLPQFEHAEQLMSQLGRGERGELRIGMECHPCYQWLLKIVGPFLERWPDVDIDVKQKFQFGGIGALFNHEIDLLVTPDPLYRPGLIVTPVFEYEQRLAISAQHPLASKPYLLPEDLQDETLISYPVEKDRLDIYTQFFLLSEFTPKKHKEIETTDIMMHMVAAGRGVAALPGWLIDEYADQLPITSLRLGSEGIAKHISLCTREADARLIYVQDFIESACKAG